MGGLLRCLPAIFASDFSAKNLLGMQIKIAVTDAPVAAFRWFLNNISVLTLVTFRTSCSDLSFGHYTSD